MKRWMATGNKKGKRSPKAKSREKRGRAGHWGSEPGRGVDGGLRGLLGRGGYHLLSCPHSPLQTRQCRAREENDFTRSQDFSQLREGSSPHLRLPSLHLLYGTTSVLQLWHPFLFVNSKMVFIPNKYKGTGILNFIILFNFHPQKEFHLYPCTGCPQGPAWGWLLVSTLEMPSTSGQCILE